MRRLGVLSITVRKQLTLNFNVAQYRLFRSIYKEQTSISLSALAPPVMQRPTKVLFIVRETLNVLDAH